MKIYVLFYGNDFDLNVEGVCSTPELAEGAVAARRGRLPEHPKGLVQYEEHTLDELPEGWR